MFGINETGETCCLFVQDFEPFFYVKVGEKWTTSTAQAFKRELQNKMGNYYKNSLLSAELVEYHKLYGFTGGKKDKFVKLVFKNQAAFRKVKNMWYEYNNNTVADKSKGGGIGSYKTLKPLIFQGVVLELYESNLPPLLRYFHIQQISPSGWIFLSCKTPLPADQKTTTCKYEYLCTTSQVKPLADKETRVPYKICSFDIEASSSHGDFPLPIKTYKRLATNIVDIYLRQRSVMDTPSKMSILIRKIICSAFSLEKFDDVDVV